jgi:hypothetical protein
MMREREPQVAVLHDEQAPLQPQTNPVPIT